jgi:WD40 repeat protein
MTAARPCRLVLLVPLALLFGCDTQSDQPVVGLQAHSFANSEWSTPVNLGAPVNSAAAEQNATLSPDELSLYFVSNRVGGLGGNDIWIARRASLESSWEAPVNAGEPVNTSANENSPNLSPDGHLFFFASDRAGGQGSSDVYVTRRARTDDDFAWGPPANLGPEVNTTAFEAGAAYLQSSEDGARNLYFVRGPNTNELHIYVAPVGRDGETRGAASPVAELNFVAAGVGDAHPSVREDGREVVFHSTRPGGLGLFDLYVSTRRTVHEPWFTPVNLGTLNSTANDGQPTLSFDGRTVVFYSNRFGGLGNTDIWMTTRTPSGH